MDTLIEFFSFTEPNVRNVLLATVLLGITSGIVGSFALLRKKALVGDAIAHSVLPGICLAFIFWETKNPLVLMGGALVAGWLSLYIIDLISTRSRIPPDAALGLVLTTFFGIGILLLTRIQHSGNAAQAGLENFLFGNAASIVEADVYTMIAVSIIILLTTFLFFKEFKLIAFDRDYAIAAGLPVRHIEITMSTLTVLAVVIGIQSVGVVLMAAMLITPAAAAGYWTNDLKKMLLYAALVGVLSGILGSYISYVFPQMPTGPWIIVAASAFAIASILFAPKKGWWPRIRRIHLNKRKILSENMLKRLYKMNEKSGEFSDARTVQELAEQLQVEKGKLTGSLKKLKSEGLILETDAGWQLSKAGISAGQRIVRIHRLWELYLSTYLKIAPDHVHEDAEAIEHVITPEIEQRLEELLRYPQQDPHQRDIPYTKNPGN